MKLVERLFGTRARPPDETKAADASGDLVLHADDIPVHDETIPNTLDLGWYFSEEKAQLQMAKVAQEDRATHLYVIGATGSGKTKFLEFLIQQDIRDGNGFAVIDPHGDLVEDIKGFLACYADDHGREVFDRVIVVDPTDPTYTVGFNPLEKIPGISVAEQAQELISAFRKMWADSWGSRMEDLLRNSLIALGEAGLTLVELPRFLTSQGFRRRVLQQVSHPVARDYFERFDALTDRARITWIEPVTNKVNALLADERVGQLFASPKSTFQLREAMDSGKVLLVKLDKGRLRDSADLLGSLILAKIKMAAFSRTDVPPRKRRPFYLYIDEFQNFATDSFSVMLSEARKYGLFLVMAHQTLAQVSSELRSLVLGNTGIQVYFRVGHQDAQVLADEAFVFSPHDVKSASRSGVHFRSAGEQRQLLAQDIQDLPPRVCYVKHKIEGGLIVVHTVDVEPAYEVLGLSEEKYPSYLSDLPIGRRYVVPRDLVTGEVASRKQRLDDPSEVSTRGTATRQRVLPKRDENTHDQESTEGATPQTHGEKSTPSPRPAIREIPQKLLPGSAVAGETSTHEVVQPAPAKARQKPAAAAAENTSQHRYLQSLVKRVAEQHGFRAIIEQPTPDGQGKVDVGLERDGRRIACEISVTTTDEHELSNILKCLRAGYDRVILCSPEKRVLDKVRTLVEERVEAHQRDKVVFLSPDQVVSYLEEEAARHAGREETVKGYRVKLQYQPVTEEEKKARREAVTQVLLQSLRRMKERESSG